MKIGLLKEGLKKSFSFLTRKNKHKIIWNNKIGNGGIFEKCLLIYITNPFEKRSHTHTNSLEVRKLYSILNEKYIVDVIDFQDTYHLKKMDWPNYKFVITIDDKNLSKVFQYKNENTKVIYYATGANFLWQNPAEIAAVEDLRKRLEKKGIDGSRLKPNRISNENYKASIAAFVKCDALWYLGNDWNLSTWMVYGNIPKYRIHTTGFAFYKLTGTKVIGENIKNYLWFAGNGMVHKGLDLCIDAFERHPELRLYVAGRKDCYWEIYEKFLKLPNVKYLDFLDTKSRSYQNICNLCAFSICPSCSEASATSILTLMNMGLVPIISRECGIDVEGRGFLVERNVDSIDAMLTYTSNIDANEVVGMSNLAREYAAKEHSMKAYERSVRTALIKMGL